MENNYTIVDNDLYKDYAYLSYIMFYNWLDFKVIYLMI